MKKIIFACTLGLFTCFPIQTPVFAACTQEQIARMIVNNIGQDQIDSTCGKIRDTNCRDQDANAVDRGDLQEAENTVLALDKANGVGAGVGVANISGVTAFYERNLSRNSQLHTQLTFKLVPPQSLSGGATLEVYQNLLLFFYRRFLSSPRGLYYGVGGGYGLNRIIYSSGSYQYSASGAGLIAAAELGWQLSNGFFFQAGLQPAAYVHYVDNYDESSILDVADQRDKVSQAWTASKNPTQISLGLGLFF